MSSNPEQDIFKLGTREMEEFMKRYELNRLHKDFLQKVSLLVIASLGFISAIAWDQAFKMIFAYFFGAANSLAYVMLYAAIVTLIAVLVSSILTKLVFRKGK